MRQVSQGKKKKKKKNICECTVTQPTLIFGPDPKGFYRTFKRQLFYISYFRFQTMFSHVYGIVKYCGNKGVILTHGW